MPAIAAWIAWCRSPSVIVLGMTSRRQTGGLVPRSVTFRVMMFLLALVFGALATIFHPVGIGHRRGCLHCPALRDAIADGASLELFDTTKTEGVWISRDKSVGSLMTGRTVDGASSKGFACAHLPDAYLPRIISAAFDPTLTTMALLPQQLGLV